MKIKDLVKLDRMDSMSTVNSKIEFLNFKLDDDFFKNENHEHRWKCSCGNIVIRKWNKLKNSEDFKCKECRYNKVEERYKYEVEKDGEYEYIRSFRLGEKLPNGKIARIPYIEILHKYCAKKRVVGAACFIKFRYKCSMCCNEYEKSFAHHIEVELNQPLDKYWDFKKNNLNPYHIYKCKNGYKENGEDTRVWIKCCKNKNHESYPVACNNFVNDNRCPICKSSKGENSIINILSEKNIEYVNDEPYFKDLKGINGGLLRPDFILPNEKIWIEYDGAFHYEDKFNNGSYETQIKNDKIKDNYAKLNGWNLIRIPYWDFDNIEEILNKQLSY